MPEKVRASGSEHGFTGFFYASGTYYLVGCSNKVPYVLYCCITISSLDICTGYTGVGVYWYHTINQSMHIEEMRKGYKVLILLNDSVTHNRGLGV